MGSLKVLLLYMLCAPWDAAVLVLGLLLYPVGLAGMRWSHGVLWLDVRPESLVHRRWPYSTTFGHVVLLRPDLAGTDVEAHELVHVCQFEGAVAAGWLAAGVTLTAHAMYAGPLSWCPLFMLAPWWSYFGASVAAWLRGLRPYLDNAFERHARAEVALQRNLTEATEPGPNDAEGAEPPAGSLREP